MLIRLAAAFVLLVLAAASAFVFEAASATQRALALTESTRTTDSEVVRGQLLTQAEHALTGSWAQPLAWHAGAAEIMSGVAYLRGADAAPDSPERASAWTQSAEWGARAVSLSPVLPNAWLRLAALAEAGVANPICGVSECLANAWTTAPMMNPSPACDRLRLANSVTPLSPEDPRIDAYLQSGVSRNAAAQCLNFLAPEDLFLVLARQRTS